MCVCLPARACTCLLWHVVARFDATEMRARTHACARALSYVRALSHTCSLSQIFEKAGKLRTISAEHSIDTVWSATQSLFDSLTHATPPSLELDVDLADVRVAELKQAAWDLLHADDHEGALQEVHHPIYCCFFFTASLLLLYCFFTASLLQGAFQEVETLKGHEFAHESNAHSRNNTCRAKRD